MFFEVLRLTYHSPITIAVVTWTVLLRTRPCRFGLASLEPLRDILGATPARGVQRRQPVKADPIDIRAPVLKVRGRFTLATVTRAPERCRDFLKSWRCGRVVKDLSHAIQQAERGSLPEVR